MVLGHIVHAWWQIGAWKKISDHDGRWSTGPYVRSGSWPSQQQWRFFMHQASEERSDGRVIHLTTLIKVASRRPPLPYLHHVTESVIVRSNEGCKATSAQDYQFIQKARNPISLCGINSDFEDDVRGSLYICIEQVSAKCNSNNTIPLRCWCIQPDTKGCQRIWGRF